MIEYRVTVAGDNLAGVSGYLELCTEQLRARGLTVQLTELEQDVAAADTPDLAVHDNEQPFKCPACGATYATQVECANQHPAEQTQPTTDVLGGAELPEKTDAGADAALTAPPAAEPAAADPQRVTPAPDPQPPAWPA